MPEIFEPHWKPPLSYWGNMKPTRIGLVVFFALFYVPAVACDLLLFLLVDKTAGITVFATSVLIKLIIALCIYHLCYFASNAIYRFLFFRQLFKKQIK